ncbi:MAG: hypothetical protein ABGY42_03230 [bacterium]
MAARTKGKSKGDAGKASPGGSELAALRKEIASADAKKERAVTRATKALREENEELEAHLTNAVQEIGQLRFAIDRVTGLEKEMRGRDCEIERLRGEVSRLEAAVSSGRPTALAAAAAAGSQRVRGLEVLIGRPRQSSN